MTVSFLRKLRRASVKTRLLNPFDEYWDRRLGISTFGYVPSVGEADAPDLQMHYAPTPYRVIFRIIEHLDIGPDDTVVDFGCGPGRFAFAAGHAGCRRSVGVEIDATLHAQALENTARSTVPRERMEFNRVPVQEYDPVDVTRVYLFHPFGPGTLASVLGNFGRSIAASPRHVRIAYNNPVHAQVVDDAGIFTRTAEWKGNGASLPYDVTFWETAQPDPPKAVMR